MQCAQIAVIQRNMQLLFYRTFVCFLFIYLCGYRRIVVIGEVFTLGYLTGSQRRSGNLEYHKPGLHLFKIVFGYPYIISIELKIRPNDIRCHIAGRVRSKFRTIKKTWTFTEIPGRRNIWWRGFQYTTNGQFVDKPGGWLHWTAGDMRTRGTHGGRFQFTNDIICE